MNKIILFFLYMFIAMYIQAQSVIDSCYTSVSAGTSFAGSAVLANTTDADMLYWTGTSWNGQWGMANVVTPPPCSGVGQKAVWMGDQTQWTTGGEGFALKLNSPMIAGQTYSFDLTYVSAGLYSNGAFAPYFLTNSIADYGSAFMVDTLPAVGNTWTTNTITFTATASQANHQWIIVHSNDGSGMMISFCDASPDPNIDLGNDTTICIGDSIFIDAGPGFSSYSWSNGLSTQGIYASQAATYTVLVTSACGIGFDSISIATQICNAAPVVNFSSSDSVFCEKQCINFTDLSTNTPTQWQWFFNGAQPDTSNLQNPTNICYNNYGTFDVTLIACNATGCDTLTFQNFITEFQNPTDSIWNIGFTLYSQPAYTYQWYEVASGLIPGATDSFYVATLPGDYYCIIADSVGCIATSNIVNITSASIEESISSQNIEIVPNPNKGVFEIRTIYLSNILIYNLTGQLVAESRWKRFHKFEIKPGAGIYTYKVFSNGPEVVSRKFVVVD